MLVLPFCEVSNISADDDQWEGTLVAEFSDQNGVANGLVVEGFSKSQFNSLREIKTNQANLQKCFSIHVVPAGRNQLDTLDDLPAVMGKTSLVDDPPSLLFEPRFPLRDGVRYRVRVQLDGRKFQSELYRPMPAMLPTTSVEKVFPSGEQVPANLLKFYVHFSSPMAMRDSYKHIHIVDQRGRELIGAFLEIQEELWDPTARRLTLFLDPGRIKRGLIPNLEDGPVLQRGRQYSLKVDASIQDAHGQPLTESFTKQFSTTDPDYEQPRIHEWKIATPGVGTRDPMIIRFNESLDHALVDRGLQILFDGVLHEGSFSLIKNETEVHFVPAMNWQAGAYELSVATYIEDLAGNSLRKPFEVPMDHGDLPMTEERKGRLFSIK